MKKLEAKFTMIPNNFINDARLDVYEFRVLCYLMSLTDDNFSCYPSYGTIAEKTGVSLSKVKQCIKTLEEYGIIAKQVRERSDSSIATNFYTICADGKAGGESEEFAGKAEEKVSRSEEFAGKVEEKASRSEEFAGKVEKDEGACEDETGTSEDNVGADEECGGTSEDNIYAFEDRAGETDEGGEAWGDGVCGDRYSVCGDRYGVSDDRYGVCGDRYGVCGDHNQYLYTNNQNTNTHFTNTINGGAESSGFDVLMDRFDDYGMEGEMRKNYKSALEIMYNSPSITVGNETVPREKVRRRLENLSYEHIVAVDRNKPMHYDGKRLISDVRNPVAYIVTALYNSLRYTEEEIAEMEYGSTSGVG